MDDLQFGTRNKRGDWAPNARIEVAPFWGRRSLMKVLKWIPKYLAVERVPHGDGARCGGSSSFPTSGR